ncbi:hypothetical protein V7S43_002288 [Phytophthora oleae]|uniref:Uncharacterized protein n=1 Tax=Phytophthora oleae TaxID=2107226 RepID=A0ABD3G342_9STRA
MGRPRITGQGKKRKMYQRTAVAYKHKLDVLVYMDSGNNLDATIAHFYGGLSGSDIRARKKQIHKWEKQRVTIQRACESGRGLYQNLRSLGDATVLPSDAEAELVL